MKLFRFAFAVVVAMLSVCRLSADAPKGADIEFQTNVVDLGELSHDDDKQVVRLAYTNTGDLPLVVTEVRTSCTHSGLRM